MKHISKIILLLSLLSIAFSLVMAMYNMITLSYAINPPPITKLV